MPLYEYQCAKCKHRFERIRKFSDPPLKKCPECGGKAEQLLSRSAAHFKGTGWYVTDYARKSGSDSSPPPSSADKGGDSKSGEKAGSNPAEKSESKSAGRPEKKSSGKD